ncbi:MAG: homocysteine S-methyltransferase family protein [Oscillospiraceae bacterium]|nr:homocysteine S-methyltransferase family protein [Oscillospiraceae bacterium]
MDFQSLLNKPFVLLDGSMGIMLQKQGLPLGALPELLNITQPGRITNIHRLYIESGADIIYANTLGANRFKLATSGHTVEEVVSSGISAAKLAAKDTDCLVALDIGPIGQMLQPTGNMSFEEAVEIFGEQVRAGVRAGADVIVLETFSDLGEMRAAVLAAKENSTLPIMCTMTFDKNHRTFTGCSVASMALTLEGLGVDAIGFNCSLGPDDFIPLVEELSSWTKLPIIAKPNAGLPDPASGEFNFSDDRFARCMRELAGVGIKFAGGCCGTTPSTISTVRAALNDVRPIRRNCGKLTAVCSATKAVTIDRVRIIGERINPTGKAKFKQALLRQDIDYILAQAIEQIEAGADILDVNVGMPGIDEKDLMIKCVNAIQGVVDAPLQLDSSDVEVLEAGLRHYHGKAIVNSVNGDLESLQTVLPLVKKYGAAVIGLTLDKNGIPPTALQRFAIAQRILEHAQSLGIARENVFIDCLTLTASAEQEAARETLNAVRMVKEKLGLKTVLGVSNISFGLPNRELINQTFLTLALAHGLDLPIINPNAAGMTGAVRAFHVLYNYDKSATDFIDTYSVSQVENKVDKPEQGIDLQTESLSGAIEKGFKNDTARLTTKLLKSLSPMDVINAHIIPALDRVGEAFDKGQLFLPQLIGAASAAQSAFEVIKVRLSSENAGTVSKGKIVLATVKGDIHDIGKNIVKVLLENYGYTVIDLGRDVDCQAVVDAARWHGADIVGLSALMTTTLKSMEDTIALLHKNNVPAKVMVGGAVLTPEFAKKIGADYYAADARQSIDIAREVIG